MAFKIIRNDITKVMADAIVNTANPDPDYAAGVDAAIYAAAGTDALLHERKKIGEMNVGQAAVTPAFALDAKYIIHTVGPAWVDGKHGEFADLRSCYVNSLNLAQELGCESIAFPLIATGVYGFPVPDGGSSLPGSDHGGVLFRADHQRGKEAGNDDGAAEHPEVGQQRGKGLPGKECGHQRSLRDRGRGVRNGLPQRGPDPPLPPERRQLRGAK